MKESDSGVLESILESLRPRQNRKIMDLVEEAGIDVVPWGVKKDGSAVKNPRKNPAYCFEWAFGGSGQPAVLCIWHHSLSVSQDLILYEDSIRQRASKLYRIATDRSNSSYIKSSAGKQARRAEKFDSLLQWAYRKHEPVRVIILEGKSPSQPELDWEEFKVKYRMLDSEVWHVHSYSDDDGLFRVVRKVPPGRMLDREDIPSSRSVFIDQFSLSASVAKHESTGFIFDRSLEVRRAVLERAEGVCECCGIPGFKMDNGRIFLETHHVIPLSKNGPDEEWNVVAICPNDHRRAHFGEDRAALRDQLLQYLWEIYPKAEDAIRTLLETDSDAKLLS
ncbi:MAG TPA: HNH endonuclease signature motif containing protein [Nitrosospira sp.]|nr:HNH endonuclease signature motif containing protein [Nitrosospira sp.]